MRSSSGVDVCAAAFGLALASSVEQGVGVGEREVEY